MGTMTLLVCFSLVQLMDKAGTWRMFCMHLPMLVAHALLGANVILVRICFPIALTAIHDILVVMVGKDCTPLLPAVVAG